MISDNLNIVIDILKPIWIETGFASTLSSSSSSSSSDSPDIIISKSFIQICIKILKQKCNLIIQTILDNNNNNNNNNSQTHKDILRHLNRFYVVISKRISSTVSVFAR